VSECPICGRKTESDTQFCQYHDLANENITESFEDWNLAMEIQWDEYLLKLNEEESLGKFAREVVEYLMQQDGFSE
jgi:hypothetical protein